MEKICVAVRVRPSVSESPEVSPSFLWNILDNNISLHNSLTATPVSGISYSFDHVFDQASPNSRIYELLTKDIIHAAVEGFNGTVFAYGQTSSGKTFTMNGSENDPGIIHRAVKDIFDILQKRGVFVAGLREEIVNNAEQVHKLLEAGEVNRHFGETNMNVRSSRSHTIVRMVIESKSKEMDSSMGYSSSDAIRVSVLNLVDLAGSERIAKTGADGVRLKEGKHINKSLMVLGNVINKLSEGARQRGHIPYRDSKLTRILQSALGGNAKTSIICTLAPDEVHVEETKGTLQFASRAKRVTNCAQVNEILTDAALLKRQKLEIEELRENLQGSRAEVLEQEVFKLRNDLLKYELERENLSMELEEERKLHRQKDHDMKEQQIKIESLSNLVNFSASDLKRHRQGEGLPRQGISERSISSKPIWQEESLSTPSFKAVPNSFVIKRSDYSTVSDCDLSPLPDAFNNVVDEDLWAKINNGYVADLDSIQMTPAVNVRSMSSDGISPSFSKVRYEHEIQNLTTQLEVAVIDKEELEKRHREQVLLNNQLTKQREKLQVEAKVAREIPQMFGKSVATCSEIYTDVLSVMQRSVPDEKSFANKLLFGMSEIGTNIFSTLGSHCRMDYESITTFTPDNSFVQEQCKALCDKLNCTVALLASSEVESTAETESSTLRSSDYKAQNTDVKSTINESIVDETKNQSTSLPDELLEEDEKMEKVRGKLTSCQSPLRKPLSHIYSNLKRMSIEEVSSEDNVLPVLFESRNCTTPFVSTRENFQDFGTPLDKFSARASNMKSLLAEDYIDFLNTATREQLVKLKGIGAKRAEYIIELREASPLKSLNDLEKIGLSYKQVCQMFSKVARSIFEQN